MKITTILTGKDRRSCFSTKEVMPIEIREGQIQLSTPMRCSSMFIHEFDDHFFKDWHNPPEPQYVVVLAGELEIQLQDGSSQTFTSGDMFLAEDTTGSGHRTRGIKAGRCLVINRS